MIVRAALLAVAASLLASCTGAGALHVKDPGRVPDLTTTTAVDFSQMGINGVSNRTTTSIAMGPGHAGLAGVVTGPDGPVPSATVHVERLVGGSTATTDVATLADGTWTLPSIYGGRYRVRAWRTPDLALTKPQIFYIESSENKTLNLQLDRYSGLGAAASIAPNPPVYGQPANLSVLVTQRSVDSGGVVRGVPQANTQAQLGGTGYALMSPNPQFTDANGVALWRVSCDFTPTHQLSVTLADGSTVSLDLPACVAATADTSSPGDTTPPPVTSTSTPRRTTSSRSGF